MATGTNDDDVDPGDAALEEAIEEEDATPVAPAFPTAADHAERGRRERARLPRRALGHYEPAADRADPVEILRAQEGNRVPELVPIRHGRMAVSPFTFYRGAAAIMAADLGSLPHTSLRAQLCGDAHLSNFGIYASPERTLVFDLNDFDETLPGPFEWDVKRLVASFVIAGRSLGWSQALSQKAALFAMGAYRLRMAEYARMTALDVWYSRITIEDLVSYIPREREGVARILRAAAKRDNMGALNKLTEEVDGRRRFRTMEPLLVRLPDDGREVLDGLFRQYRRSLPPERRVLLDRYHLVDIARKVVGVGSVGTRCWVIYLEGSHGDDPLFLQVKEANASVLEGHAPRSAFRHQGQRVVVGQKLMQAASDLFLGWMTGPLGPQYYWRQLWDAKLSANLETIREEGLLSYARVCGWALARAHARSGSASAIAAYVGTNGRFEHSMLDFAYAYADQNDADYRAMRAAIDSGRIESTPGI